MLNNKKSLWLILALVFLSALYYIFFAHTIYADAENNCRIDIYPSIGYKRSNIVTAIGIVKANSPEYYKKLCGYVTAVDSGDKYACTGPVWGYKIMGCAHGGSRIAIQMRPSASMNELAMTLVHETCHFEQGRHRTDEDYRDLQALKEKDENECYKEGDLFFNKIEHLEGSDTATHRIFYFPNKTN